MSNWLLNRLFAAGDQAEPRFAFQGTVNWMRALAEAVKADTYNEENLSVFYRSVSRRPVNSDADTIVFENMFMAYHNLASLTAMNNQIEQKYDICRSAIIAWYYAVYFSASAMVAASSGSSQETHTATAKVWQSDIAEKNLIPYPFNLFLTSLVTAKAEAETSAYRGHNTFDLNHYAQDADTAHGAIVSYLKGTHGYKKWESEERIKSSREFKQLGVNDFRTKAARGLRDGILDKGQVNFLIQAFRYRGKANYRDSIFLSYGANNNEAINQFIMDLMNVSIAFIRAASKYSSARVERGTWEIFFSDIQENTRLSFDLEVLKI